jgi:hypothetical protein
MKLKRKPIVLSSIKKATEGKGKESYLYNKLSSLTKWISSPFTSLS